MSRNRRIYIGKLSQRTRERDIEDAFAKYGKINTVDLKRGYAFVEYDDERDAEDAIRAMDGNELDGARIIVEASHGGRDGGRERRGPSSDECFSCGGRGHWARDCPTGSRGRGGRRYRSRSRSPRGRYSSSRRYSRSRSPSPKKSRDSRSRSPAPRSPRDTTTTNNNNNNTNNDRRDDRSKSPAAKPAASRSPSPRRAASNSPRKENGNDKSPARDD